MISIKFIFMGILAATLSVQAEVNYYKDYQQKFAMASEPEASQFSPGWYSGRCYLRRAQNSIKAGVLVINRVDNKLIVSIPASSIRDEADYFDHMNNEKYQEYQEFVYLKRNSPMENKAGSLVSQLYYDILIGDLHARQIGSELLFTLTNYEESPLVEQNGYFYCHVGTKVMDLQGNE